MNKIGSSFWRWLRRRSKLFYGLLFVGFIVILSISWLFYAHSYKKTAPQKGILAEDQQFPISPEGAYKNLDLKIASKYHFPGQSLELYQTLGRTDKVNVSVVRFRVIPDNLTEYALMTEPLTPKPANGYPVIILCHGYTNPNRYSTESYYLGDMETYSNAGFLVIKPDFRGQGLSRHVGEAEGAYYSMAYNTDLMSLIADIKKTNDLDSSNISLWGHSLGAYIALRTAVMSPDIKNLILLSGPVGYVDDMYRSFVPISDRNNPEAETIKQAVLLRYGTPLSNPKFWNATSPLSYLGQLKAKVQIYVGSLDRTVPPHFSADLDKALAKAGKKHQLFVFPGGNHGLLIERPQIYQSSLQLLLSGPA